MDTESTPPDNTCEARIAAIRLAMVPGVGPRIRQLLLERFESAVEVFRAAPSELRDVKGVGPKLMNAIVRAVDEIDVESEIRRCDDHGVRILIETDDDYPRMLKEVCDPPGVLFVRGRLRETDALAVAIVGTRHPTAYGKQQAERLAGGLARAGLTVISGLARGVDGVAHRAAMAAGGRTIAVLGSGVMNIYPPEHKDLSDDIARSAGAVISENPPMTAPQGGMFPQRNRIISGMTLGTIVVEAAYRSGALITARHAMEQNREVFAVPGRVDCRMAGGCNRLIRDGATLIESVDDVLEQLGPLVEPIAGSDTDGRTVHSPAELQLNDIERAILDLVEKGGTPIDTVIADSGMAAHQVIATLSVLEMRRLVRRTGGGTVVRI